MFAETINYTRFWWTEEIVNLFLSAKYNLKLFAMQALHHCSPSGYVCFKFSEGPADDLGI